MSGGLSSHRSLHRGKPRAVEGCKPSATAKACLPNGPLRSLKGANRAKSSAAPGALSGLYANSGDNPGLREALALGWYVWPLRGRRAVEGCKAFLSGRLYGPGTPAKAPPARGGGMQSIRDGEGLFAQQPASLAERCKPFGGARRPFRALCKFRR
jgi:hypothetical protein